jgi:hypothetical protein
MQALLYRILDAEARNWWHHAALRRSGNKAEARTAERRSIRHGLTMWREAQDGFGAHLVISARGDVSLSYGQGKTGAKGSCRVTGMHTAPDVAIAIARYLRITAIDNRPADYNALAKLVISGPMPAQSERDLAEPRDGWPTAFSYVDPTAWAVMHRAVGSLVYLPGE